MLVSELDNLLVNFVKKDNPFKTMLIDGKWGCGKTYSINKIINKNFKANHIYLSLFGIKKEEDIVVRLSEYLDSTYITNINGEHSIKSSLIECLYNGLLVVFDDLERMDNALHLSAIYGIVNALRNLGFKIICICNSESIGDKESFDDFRDKTFDLVANVEGDAGQFLQIVDVDVNFEKTLLKIAGENWRIIKRAGFLYKDIIQTAKENGLEDILTLLDLDKNEFFRCVTLAEICFFGNNRETPSFDKDDFNKIAYDYDIEELGKIVGNNFYLLFAKEKENHSYKETVRAILKSLINSDGYKAILERAKPVVSNQLLEQHPFNKELFYLDDKGHSEYKKAFLDNLQSFDFSDRQQQRVVASVISNCAKELTQKEIGQIIERIIETVPVEDSMDVLENISVASNDGSNEFKSIITKLRSGFENKLNIERKKKIEILGFEKNYKDLTNYLYENRYATTENKKTILSFLKNKDFFLPDLSKEVDYSIWSYCHEAARFVAKTECESEYIKVLEGQCRKSNSKELRRKCNALVKYNFEHKIDFFELFPLKTNRNNNKNQQNEN